MVVTFTVEEDPPEMIDEDDDDGPLPDLPDGTTMSKSCNRKISQGRDTFEKIDICSVTFLAHTLLTLATATTTSQTFS
jgi:hypothetical protein